MGLIFIFEMILVLVLVGFIMFMLVLEWICVDMVVLLVVVVIGLIGLIFFDCVFNGFVGNVVIVIIVIMIMGVGLDCVGVFVFIVNFVMCMVCGMELCLGVVINLVISLFSVVIFS